ncbi:MAG: hypothetical protein EHM18_05660 [Acidobacteria bacterium]|nr:MAG: hypothetical protein EHM18_05660 [Acidobacteriota bacterium]
MSTFLLFLVITPFVVLKSARDALVLTEFSGASLPYFMVVTTLLVAVLTGVQLRLNERLAVGTVLAGGLLFYAVGTFALHLAVRSGWSLAVPVLYVWANLFGAQIPMLAWVMIGRRLKLRQAKRAIGVIGAGAVAGSVGGGLIAERVAQLGDTPDLLAGAALFMVAALVPVTGLALCRVVESEDDSGKETETQLSRRFITAVLLVVAAGTIVSTFAEFQFKIIAQREVSGVRNLTAFFGWFYAYLGVATLVFQIAITPLIVRWGGVTAGLVFLPAALLTGNGLIVGLGTLWSAVILRGGDQLFRHSIDRSSLEVLYTAVSGKARIKLKALLDAFGVRAAESAAGLILVLLFSIAGLPLITIGILGIVICVVWLAAAVLLRGEYRQILTQAVQRQDVDIEGLKKSLFGPDFQRLLPHLLASVSTRTWLHLLDLLDTGGQKQIGPRVSLLLRHGDPQVRKKALHLLFAQPHDYSADVERLIGDVDRTVRTEAIRYICSRSPQPMGRLFTFLQDPDPSVQVAACSCSLLTEQEDSRELALRKLEDLLTGAHDPDRPDVRLEIARVLEDFAGFDASLQLARRLLQDPAIEVRRAAIKSVSKSRAESLVPVLFTSFKEPRLWADLRTALAEYGPALLPHVRKLLPLSDTPLELKKLLLQVMSDINDEEGLELLIKQAESQNLSVRFQAIKGLNRFNRRQGLNGFRPRIQHLLEKEIRELQENEHQIGAFSTRPATLIGSLLAQRRRWAQERVFRLLGLMYDQNALQKAYFAFSDGSDRLFDTALELLDSVLDLEHKRSIIPLLESRAVGSDSEPSPVARKETLLQFIKRRDQLAAAAALADLQPAELGKWRPDLKDMLGSGREQSLVSETLQWRYRMAQPEANASREPDSLTTIQKLESLSKVDIFSRLGPHELLLLSNSSAVQDYAEGEIIYREGETAHHIYNLLEGRIELRRQPDQVEEITPGGSFGALAVLSGQPRFFTAQVVETARCIKVEREAFWEMVEDYPSAARAIFEVLSGQILTMMGRLSEQKDEEGAKGKRG